VGASYGVDDIDRQGPCQFAADSPLEGAGFEPSVPLREARGILVMVARFKILSRLARGRSTSLDRLETSREPGERRVRCEPVSRENSSPYVEKPRFPAGAG